MLPNINKSLTLAQASEQQQFDIIEFPFVYCSRLVLARMDLPARTVLLEVGGGVG